MNISEANAVNRLLDYLRAPSTAAEPKANLAAQMLAARASAAISAGQTEQDVAAWWPTLAVQLSPQRKRVVQTDLTIAYRHPACDQALIYDLSDCGVHYGDVVRVSVSPRDGQSETYGIWVSHQGRDCVDTRLVLPMVPDPIRNPGAV